MQNGDGASATECYKVSDRSKTEKNKYIDQLETIAGIQQGFEELNAGLTRPIENFVQEMQQKYDISG